MEKIYFKNYENCKVLDKKGVNYYFMGSSNRTVAAE